MQKPNLVKSVVLSSDMIEEKRRSIFLSIVNDDSLRELVNSYRPDAERWRRQIEVNR